MVIEYSVVFEHKKYHIRFLHNINFKRDIHS